MKLNWHVWTVQLDVKHVFQIMDLYHAHRVIIYMNTTHSTGSVDSHATIYHTMPGHKISVFSVMWEHIQMLWIKLVHNVQIIVLIAGNLLLSLEDNRFVVYVIQTSLVHQLKCVRNNAILHSTLMQVFLFQIAKIADLSVLVVQTGIIVTSVNLNSTFKVMEVANLNVLTQRWKCGIRKSNNVKLLYSGFNFSQ